MKSAAYYQGNDLRKPSGGRKGRVRKTKLKALCGGPPQLAKLGDRDERIIEFVRGGNIKIRLKTAKYANVYVPSQRKHVKAKITGVISTPANPDYAKREAIVKGSVIQTEIGKAVVVSRPSQHGVINAVLIE